MKNFFRVLICIYIVIAVFTTFNLLTYNKLNISEFNNKHFIKLSDDVGIYKKGSMLVVDKTDSYIAGENVFYCELKKDKCVVSYGKVDTVMGDQPMVNNQTISKKLILGKDNYVRVYPYIGGVMNFFESRWIYLCFIVLPLFIGFIFEIRMYIMESKKEKKK